MSLSVPIANTKEMPPSMVSTEQHKILVVEDDNDLREALCDTLMLNGFECIEADCGEAGISAVNSQTVHFVVSDVNMPGIDGHEFMAYLKKHRPEIPVLLITAYGSVSKAVDAMQNGAVDYLVKPFEPHVLTETVQKHLAISSDVDEPVAVEPSSRQVLMLAQKVAKTDSTILISGESGTGKEVLARYIHSHSHRRDQPFIAINCAAIPENMLEATLFGHEKGAFTGAVSSAPGKFEQANGGTILLDEISEMDLGLQAKLLRVLQEREVERIGGRKTIKLDVRVLATTNRNLLTEVRQNQFREDLYYRLSVFPLQWKPLRERRLDLVPLAEKLVQIHQSKMGKSGLLLTPRARQAIMEYTWPGNVREMDNAIQRALILQTGFDITAEDLGLVGEEQIDFEQSRPTMEPQFTDGLAAPRYSHNDLGANLKEQRSTGYDPVVPRYVAPQDSIHPNGRREPTPISDPSVGNNPHELGVDLKRREFELIVDAIRQCGGRKKMAAEKLGISPRTLRYKLAKLREMGIDVDRAIAG